MKSRIGLIIIFFVNLTYSQEREDINFNLDVLQELERTIKQKFYKVSLVSRLSEDKILNRLKAKHKFLKIGLLTSKDLFKYSLKVNLKPIKIFIGNYYAYYGQGLVMNPPLYSSKKTSPLGVSERKDLGIKQDLSTYYKDNPYFQGVAISLPLERLNFDICYSQHKLDASLNKDKTARTVYLSGNEKYKDTLCEELYASRISFTPKNLKLGSTYYYAKYNPKLCPKEEFKLKGDKNVVYGIDIDTSWKNVRFLGEYAIAKNQKVDKAFITSGFLNLKNTKLVVSWRKYGKDFYNLHGFAFPYQSKSPNNEYGKYFGFKYMPIKKLKILGYYDIVDKDPKRNRYKLEKLKEVGLGIEGDIKYIKKVFLRFQEQHATASLIKEERKVKAKITKIILELRKKFNLLNFDYQYLFQVVTADEYKDTENIQLYAVRLNYPFNQYLQFKSGYCLALVNRSMKINTYPYHPILTCYEDEVYGGYIYPYSEDSQRFYILIGLSLGKLINITSKYRYLIYKDSHKPEQNMSLQLKLSF
jgi:hypothetical protein